MKNTMKKILCTLLVVILCITSAPLSGLVGLEWPDLLKIDFNDYFVSNTNAAYNYNDGLIINGSKQVLFLYNLNGGTMKDDVFVYDPTTSKFALTENVKGIYVDFPRNSDMYVVGDTIKLYDVNPPNSLKFEGWECNIDGKIYKVNKSFFIPENMAGEVISFVAKYEDTNEVKIDSIEVFDDKNNCENKFDDFVSMGLIMEDHALILYDLNCSVMKHSFRTYNEATNIFKHVNGVAGSSFSLPKYRYDQTLGSSVKLPAVIAPSGFKVAGWRCSLDGNLYKEYSEYIIPEEAIGQIVEFKIEYTNNRQIPEVKASWFEEGSYSGYNHELAQFCVDYCLLGYDYNEDLISYYLDKTGFTLKSSNMKADRDEVNYFIADKNITVNGQSKTLVFVGCIGSYKSQWYSNFDPWSYASENDYAALDEMDHTHHGFANAREYMYKQMEDYVMYNNIDPSNSIVLFTGHSRGSATINLLAAKLIDNASQIGLDPNNIYSYGFATPNTCLTSNGIMFSKYDSIINIVNPEDLVTKLLPAEWNYGRYGKTYVLPSKTNVTKSYYNALLNKAQEYMISNDLNQHYEPYDQGEVAVYKFVKKITDSLDGIKDFYEKKAIVDSQTTYEYFRDRILPFVTHETIWTDYIFIAASTLKLGTLQRAITGFFADHQAIESEFENSHLIDTYVAFVKTMSSSQIESLEDLVGYKGTVNCPVDVEIYDKETGELVGRIVDNVVDEEIAAKENSVVMSVEGESKEFWLPSNVGYEVKLIGNNEGTMDYTMSEIDSDSGELKRVNFFDVEISDGLTMTADVQGEEFVIEEHELVYENGEILEPTEILDKKEITTYNIKIASTEGGLASSSQTAKTGDYVSLEVQAEEGWKFAGWYENDELVSSESAYAFVAKSDRMFEAKFEHIDHNFSDWYTIMPATCEVTGEKKRGCSVCDYSETEAIATLEHSYESVETNATCTSNGYITNTCSLCGNGYTSDITEKLSHSMSSWYVVTLAKCTAVGTEKRNCTTCEAYSETQEIPATGHNFDGSKCTSCDFDKADNCSCNCHKSGFMGFIWKIINFFNKLFKLNKTCACGVNHY